jgi:hypothetical protein
MAQPVQPKFKVGEPANLTYKVKLACLWWACLAPGVCISCSMCTHMSSSIQLHMASDTRC